MLNMVFMRLNLRVGTSSGMKIFRSYKVCLLLLLFNFCLVVTAQTVLKGDIGGLILEERGNPYFVEKDVTIPRETETVIKAGVVILFHSFSTLFVEGSFLVEGTKEKPVVFTSVNNPDYNLKAEQAPQSFDWNGIEIRETAQTIKMRNFLVSYTVFGIKSRKEDIVLINGVFSQNGQFNLTIQDKIILVQDMLSYSFNSKDEPEEKPDTVIIRDTSGAKHPYAPRRMLSPAERKLRTVSFVALGTTIVEAGLSTGFFVGYNKNWTKYKNIQSGDFAIYRDKANSYRKAGIGTAVGTGVTAAAWGVFYYMYKNYRQKEPATQIKISSFDFFNQAAPIIKVELCGSF